MQRQHVRSEGKKDISENEGSRKELVGGNYNVRGSVGRGS